VRQRSGFANSHHRLLRCLLGATVLAGAVLPVNALTAAAAAKPTSSCVACHTDVERIKEEAKGIPVPAASALQAGKG